MVVQPANCPHCTAPGREGARYCLACGERLVAPVVQAAAWVRSPVVEVASAEPAPVLEARRGGAGRVPRALALGGGAALALGAIVGALLAPATGVTAGAGRAPIVLLADGGAAAVAPVSDEVPADDDAAVPPAVDLGADDAVEADASSGADLSAETSAEADGGGGEEADDVPVDEDDSDAPQDLGSLAGGGASGRTGLAKHLWVISVGGRPVEALEAFAADGILLEHVTPVSASPAAGGAALLGGQPPNATTEEGCPRYAAVDPRTIGPDGAATGAGCLYPRRVRTLASLVAEAGGAARSYVGGQGDAACRRPPVEAPNPWLTPGADGFTLARSPFTRFATHVLRPGCERAVVDLGGLARDLQTADAAPRLSWITFDANVDRPVAVGEPDPLAPALSSVIRSIRASPAYADGGVVAVVPDAGVAPAGALLLGGGLRRGVRLGEPLDSHGVSALLSDLLGVDRLARAAATGLPAVAVSDLKK